MFNGKPEIPVGTYDVTVAPPQDPAGPPPGPSDPEAYKAVMMGGGPDVTNFREQGGFPDEVPECCQEPTDLHRPRRPRSGVRSRHEKRRVDGLTRLISFTLRRVPAFSPAALPSAETPCVFLVRSAFPPQAFRDLFNRMAAGRAGRWRSQATSPPANDMRCKQLPVHAGGQLESVYPAAAAAVKG